MAANPLAGEAELFVAGKTHLVRVSMRAIPLMCAAVGVDTWPALADAAQKAIHMEAVTRALLEANGVAVTDDDLAGMDAMQWIDRILPALLRYDPTPKESGDANPQKSRAKK